MNIRHDAETDPPDTNRDVLVGNGYGDFAVASYNKVWYPAKDLLDAYNYDGGASIYLSESPKFWWELPEDNNNG